MTLSYYAWEMTLYAQAIFMTSKERLFKIDKAIFSWYIKSFTDKVLSKLNG